MAEYRIDITGDNAPLRKAVREVPGILKGATQAQADAANQGAAATRQGVEKGAQAQFVALGKVQLAAVKLADRLGAEAERGAAAQAKAQQKAAAATFVGLDSLRAAGVKYVNDMVREEQRLAEAKDRMAKKSLTNQQVTLLANNQMVQRANQARIDAATRAVDAESGGWRASTMLAGQFRDVLSTVAGQFTLLAAGQAIVSQVAGSFERAATAAYDAGRFTQEYRKDLLELAALKGRLGDTSTEAAESLAFRAKTLQSKDAATAFQGEMRNVGASEIGAKISEKQFGTLAERAGAFQAAEGGDAGAHGRLAGSLPSMMRGQNLQAGDVMAKEDQLYRLLQLGGSTHSSGVRQLLAKADYSKTGVFKDVADQAMVQSMFSKNVPDAAGERTEQFVRATAGGLGKLRGVQVEGDHEKVGQYLHGLGADNQMDPIQIGDLIAADFRKQEAAEAKAGRKFAPMDYLLHKGYGNEQDRLALMGYTGLVNDGTRGKFQSVRDAPLSTNYIDTRVGAYQGGDPDALRRRGELAEDQAKVAVGAGPMEYLESLQKVAFSRIRARGETDFTTLDGFKHPWSGAMFGTHRLDEEVNDMLRPSMQRAGMRADWANPTGVADFDSTQTRARKVWGVGRGLASQGMDVLPGAGAVGDTAQQQLDEAKKMRELFQRFIEQQRAPAPNAPGAAPPPLNGPPPAWNARP